MELNSIYSVSLLAVLAGCAGQSPGRGDSDAGSHPSGTQNVECAPTTALNVTNTELATGRLFDSIAVDASYVYGLYDNYPHTDLVRVARTGGNREVLAELDSAWNLVVDANSVYLRTDTGISKVPKGGGSPTTLATIDHLDEWGLKHIAQDDTHVYAMNEESMNQDFTCDGQGAIFAFDKQTGEKTVLAENLKCPSGLAVDSDHAYFVVQEQSDKDKTPIDLAFDTALMRAPLAGGTPEVLAQTPLEGGDRIALSGDYAYVVTANLASFDRIPKTGGAFEQITPCALPDSGLSDVRSGKDGVYFNIDASYVFVPSDGSGMRSYAGVRDATLGDFAVDGTTIVEAGEQGLWAITR